MRAGVILWAAGVAAVLAAGLRADELVLPDGTRIRCQIYKETLEKVYWVNPEKQTCEVTARTAIQELKREDKPVVDLKEFLEKQRPKLTAQEIADLEAAIGSGSKTPPPGTKVSKTTMRPMASGVVVPRTTSKTAPELVVDPFPEEGNVKPKKSGKKD